MKFLHLPSSCLFIFFSDHKDEFRFLVPRSAIILTLSTSFFCVCSFLLAISIPPQYSNMYFKKLGNLSIKIYH